MRKFVEFLVVMQHRVLPIPLSAWRKFYSSRKVFNNNFLRYYGQLCFMSAYRSNKRLSGGGDSNSDYWLSRESLYWHYWKITDFNEGRMRDLIYSHKNVLEGNALELGFGLGKHYRFIKKYSSFTNYYATEINSYCVKESILEFPEVRFIENRIQGITRETVDKFRINTIFSFGGVLFYLTPAEIDVLFSSFKNVQNIVILDEGEDEDHFREDNTVMYDFSSRIASVWGKNRDQIIKTRILKDRGIYSMLVLSKN